MASTIDDPGQITRSEQDHGLRRPIKSRPSGLCGAGASLHPCLNYPNK